MYYDERVIRNGKVNNNLTSWKIFIFHSRLLRRYTLWPAFLESAYITLVERFRELIKIATCDIKKNFFPPFFQIHTYNTHTEYAYVFIIDHNNTVYFLLCVTAWILTIIIRAT